ncbi:carbonic anhydrase 14 isoform X3 [Mauremys mutica]|uniref:carbonic anhydrase 14 isoform X3 n=1 Tax=Mauremys mutica TaxID=74926 RepID=UPI001D15F4E4|nr:carbonic anhydrase 14 isoform X3 [Mauremys mutica]
MMAQGFSHELAANHSSHWTYSGRHGQTHWSNDYPDCGRQAQSPIDIETKSVQHDPALPPIEPQGYRSPGNGTFTLRNNGHTVVMSLPPSMFLRGLPQTYAAVQLHFHWGSGEQDEGSEHQLHIVHYNSESYANVTEAKQQADGLAVLGILIEVGDVANPAYDNIFNQLKNIQYAGQKVSIPPFDVHELLPRDLGHYFRYNGSLTTPPCSQNVLWTIFHQRVQISSSQLERLQRGLYSTTAANSLPVPLVDNYRAPQPLNQRVVISSFPEGRHLFIKPSASTYPHRPQPKCSNQFMERCPNLYPGPSAYSAGEIVAIVFGTLLGCLSIFLTIHFGVKRIRARMKRIREQKDVVFKSSSSRAVSGDSHRP